ncbi:MAG TPA: hypothetical protein VF395_12205 [Polyangiaceae bacterium]
MTVIQRLLRVGIAVAALGFFTVRPASGQDNPRCIDVWPEARYRNYGYDHIVHINNHCAERAVCEVSTDVSPRSQRVTVDAGQELEVLTFRGSPSRDFQPLARCGLILSTP